MGINSDNLKTQVANVDRLLELAELPVTQWSEQEILNTITNQFNESDNYTRQKKGFWVDYTRLYLNQYRKSTHPDSLGSKMLFTKFNEAYANFANDDVSVEFEPRSLDDLDIVANTNIVRKFDWESINGTDIWNSRLWDRLFYGFDVLDVSDFDDKSKLLKPVVVNPYFVFFDPLAADVENARFMGQYKYLTYWDMLQRDSDFDVDKVKYMAKNLPSRSTTSNDKYLQSDTAKQVLLGVNYYQEPLTSTTYYEILQWFIRNNGKVYRVWTDNSFSTVLGVTELDYKDGEGETSEIPYIVTPYYRLPRQMIGIGIPDILEDAHRASVKLSNYMLEGIKNDAMPTFLYKHTAFLNPRDLLTREINKNIPTTTEPATAVYPFPKTNVVTDQTLSFLQMLENSGDAALTGARQSRGVIGAGRKQTATQAALDAQRNVQLMASVSKNFLTSEKRFWYIWLARYRRYLGKDDEKMVRILGQAGAKTLMKLKYNDFMPSVDPDIEVVSKLMSEPTKLLARRDLSELVQPIIQAGGNVKEVIKRLLYLIDMRKEDINEMLPPTPDELRAEGENDMLEEDKVPLIHESDDDVTHIAVHQRAKDSDIKDRHIKAHGFNYLRKKGKEGENTPEEAAGTAAPQLGKTTPTKVEQQLNPANPTVEQVLAANKQLNIPATVK